MPYDHAEPVGRVDHGDQGDQRGDLIVVVVLAHLGPGLVGHPVVGVGEPGALLGERQRGPLGLGEHGGLAPGGDQVEPDRGFAGGGSTDPATEAFVAHRNLLFTVAYEILGSAADAEDVLQETWLRWAGVDLGTVRDQRAYLVRITTPQALAPLRTLGRRRESYVGPWLPEPLLTAPDVAEDVALADSV